MLRGAAIYLIDGYQRFISPYKGYTCAYRVHAGRAWCSAFGKRVISGSDSHAASSRCATDFARVRRQHSPWSKLLNRIERIRSRSLGPVPKVMRLKAGCAV
jgi:putative component of membrane protein insertase Oxa1/YidC/SpoIIIJ protein YidD